MTWLWGQILAGLQNVNECTFNFLFY